MNAAKISCKDTVMDNASIRNMNQTMAVHHVAVGRVAQSSQQPVIAAILLKNDVAEL